MNDQVCIGGLSKNRHPERELGRREREDRDGWREQVGKREYGGKRKVYRGIERRKKRKRQRNRERKRGREMKNGDHAEHRTWVPLRPRMVTRYGALNPSLA